MAKTYSELRDQVVHFYEALIPEIKQSLSKIDLREETFGWSLEVVDDFEERGVDLEMAKPVVYGNIIRSAQHLYGMDERDLPLPFPSAPPASTVAIFADHVDPRELIDFLLQDLPQSERDKVARAFESSDANNVDILESWVEVSAESEGGSYSAVDIINNALEKGHVSLPAPDLNLDGLSESQIDFLVGVYVAAFSRAPEHEGLEYWSGSLKHFLEQGMSEPDAFKQIARDMYWSGEQNGEAGTTLSNYDYAAYLYESVLGRQPDAKGLDYWFGQLESLNLGRNEFISVFLNSALAPGNGDGDYVRARVEVAKFVSQEYLSGPNGPGIDLVAILDGVTNAAQAKIVIDGLIDTYGPGPAQAFAMSQAVAVDNTDLDIIMLHAQGFDDALYSDPYFDAQIESQDASFIDVAGDTSYSYDLA